MKSDSDFIFRVRFVLRRFIPEYFLLSFVYASYMVFKNGKKVLYVEVLWALYGMLVAALLWYKTLKKDLEQIGFGFNPYDPCICN